MTSVNAGISDGTGAHGDHPGPHRPNPTFLVVDDEPLSAQFLASVAQEAGWTTDVACTAAIFDAKLERGHPDAIALDLSMPDRDGVELLRQLSTIGYRGRLIIVSACDQPIVESSALLAAHRGLQVAGFAQKPITPEAFTALLDGARPGDDGTAS